MLPALGFPASADVMKIAVAANGNTVASPVSPVAAKSTYVLIFDGKGAFVEALSNPHKDVGGGASALVIDLLSGRGVTTMVAGNFGDKMIAGMKAKRITFIEFKGTAAEAIKKALK